MHPADCSKTMSIPQQRSDFVFNVRNIRLWSGDRNYRLYFRDGEFFFIRIGGQSMDAVAAQFGLIGALIAGWFRRGQLSTEQIADLDRSQPKDLLAQHKHNFSLRTSDVIESSLDPAPLVPQYGVCTGRWTLRTRDGTKWSFQFDELEPMHAAIQYLPTVLGPQIRVGARWDEEKQQYRKA
jgi:hypothetical protein